MPFWSRLSGREKPQAPDPARVCADLRGQALSWTAEQFGSGGPGDTVFGVLVDMGLGGGVATIVSMADGTTSMYASTGGGVIGAGAHAQVAGASRALIAVAERQRELLSLAWDDVALGRGEVRLIALTPSGPIAATGRADDLAAGDQPLSPLFLAANDVITQVRLISSG